MSLVVAVLYALLAGLAAVVAFALVPQLRHRDVTVWLDYRDSEPDRR